MGHEQPKTRVITDNALAVRLIDKSMTPKLAKLYDQRFNWLKCREAQKLFDLVWGKQSTTEPTISQNATQQASTKTKEAAMLMQQLELNKLLARVCLIISNRESYPGKDQQGTCHSSTQLGIQCNI